MPPKPKFTREEVIEAALRLVEEGGTQALTARSLGVRLKSSARPVFTLFPKGMEEVLSATERAARDLYNGYVRKGLEEDAFKGVGKAYIRFAMEKPRLFEWLFMRKRQMPLDAALMELDENYENILSSVHVTFPTTKEKEKRLYQHLWIYSHGVATLCATQACKFTPAEIETMLREVGAALRDGTEDKQS